MVVIGRDASGEKIAALAGGRAVRDFAAAFARNKKPPRFPAAASVFAEGSSTNKTAAIAGGCFLTKHRVEEINSVFGRPGSDLLSRVLRRTTIGAEEFYGRVRDGIGYRLLAETTRSAKDGMKQAFAQQTRSPRA